MNNQAVTAYLYKRTTLYSHCCCSSGKVIGEYIRFRITLKQNLRYVWVKSTHWGVKLNFDDVVFYTFSSNFITNWIMPWILGYPLLLRSHSPMFFLIFHHHWRKFIYKESTRQTCFATHGSNRFEMLRHWELIWV